MAGTIVIGEGERDEAPMLYIGEQVGRGTAGGDRDAPAIDIAVDPLEGTNLVAHGQADAITVLAASERAASSTPRTRTSRSCASGRSRRARSTSRRPPAENVHASPRRSAARSTDITVDHPRAAAPRRPDRRGPRRRRADQAHLRRRPVRRDLLRGLGHRRPRGDGHRRRAGGRDHRGGAALPRRRDPGPLPVSATTRSGRAARGWATATRTASTAPRTSPRASTSCSRRPA